MPRPKPMPTFVVQLAEIRWLAATLDAKDPAAAIRQTRRAWSKVSHSAPLPFELQAAKLITPAMAARPLKPRRKRRRQS